MPLLDVSDLKMYYNLETRGWVKAVDGINFQLERGKTLGIVGESGCGKSSLAITIMRILPTNGAIMGGHILLGATDIVTMPEDQLRRDVRWKRIAMVFQGAMNAMNPVFKIGDQIVEAIMTHDGMNETEAHDRAGELLELVGVDRSRATNYPHEFSGGMRQRAMIAMALALQPEILIADEPTTALDVIVQAQVLKLLSELKSKLGLSLILISHDVSIVSEMSDHIAVMYAGRIVEYGSSEDVMLNPKHPYTHGLLSAVPSTRGRKRSLESIPGIPPNLLTPPPGCRFHPRCPYVIDRCKVEDPLLLPTGNRQYAACHRSHERLWE